LLKIEAVFLKSLGYQIPIHHKNNKPKNPTDKDNLFVGLVAVTNYLCELDNIENNEDLTNLLILSNSTLTETQKGSTKVNEPNYN